MERGWDPEVKRFFSRILNSIAWGLIWMMTMVLAGLYFGLAIPGGRPIIYNIIFYVCMLGSLGVLLYYYWKIWR